MFPPPLILFVLSSMLICVVLFFVIIKLKCCNSYEKPILIRIEGNIGSGKSTLLNLIQSTNNNIVCIQEPIKKWEPYLTNIHKYTGMGNEFLMQLMVLDHFADTATHIENYRSKCIIIERSMHTMIQVFSYLLFESGILSIFQYNYLKAKAADYRIHYDHCFFIYTPYDVCWKRVQSRGRICETNVSMEYLRELEETHCKLMAKILDEQYTNVHIIDGTAPTEEVFQDVSNALLTIMG